MINSTEIIHDDEFHPDIKRVVAIAVDGSKSSCNALEWGNTFHIIIDSNYQCSKI